MCALQALEFMFAQQLCCVAIVTVEGNTLSGTLEPWQDPRKFPSVEPPIEPRFVDSVHVYWQLFVKVLLFLSRQDKAANALAASSGEVISSGKALLGIQAKIKSVAVETLANLIKSSHVLESTASQREELSKHLDQATYPQSFRNRVKKLIENMDNPAVKDTLYALKKLGVLEQGHINSWSKLRNKYAHGAVTKAADVETASNHMRAVVGLYYRLVFHLVGYQGASADYLSPPKAPLRVVQRPGAGEAPPSVA